MTEEFEKSKNQKKDESFKNEEKKIFDKSKSMRNRGEGPNMDETLDLMSTIGAEQNSNVY